jgi:hypothetical protein
MSARAIRCESPVSFEMLVAYWSGDLDAAETDEIDAHIFGCATCTAASERVAAVTERLRSLEPPVISSARLAELRARGRRIEDNYLAPGARKKVIFDAQDFIVHHLGGLELAGVERVAVFVRVVETGDVVAEVPDAPFDAASGEVLIACQRHFAAFPPNVAFEVTAFRPGNEQKTSHYVVEHEFVAH